MSQTAPHWLLPTFARAVRSAGGTAADAEIDTAATRLLEMWQQPSRKYHNVRHLVELLQHVDELQQETHRPHTVRLAAWYHGAIFDADASAAYAHRGGENEEASAAFAREGLAALGVPADMVDEIATMVMALARHSSNPDSMDCAVLCDADLAILAADPQRYRSYTEDVRAEYGHIPQGAYLESRGAIVRKLLSRDRLYLSPMGAGWEERARQNLKGELQRIERETAELGLAG